MTKLKETYELCCNEYAARFAKKQEIEFDGWIGDEIGGIASFIQQYFFSISDIVFDINNKCKKGLILEWQDMIVSEPEKEINYFSYSKGLRIEDNKIEEHKAIELKKLKKLQNPK